MDGLMIQGTSSDVGKSFIVTALCRLFVKEGFKVAPFKSQNMSNNSYVTVDGKEIGRAQGIQAEAAKTDATVWMNPILLKPRSDQEAEVVLFGKSTQVLSGKGYRDQFYDKGLRTIQTALQKLSKEYDVLVLEGAGSPVEINLKDRELVNMKVAELADVPVVLVADIDRGGVFASIIGTLELLTSSERKRVKGIIINKFRGDVHLFTDGVKWLEEKTGIPVLGILPYVNNHMIDHEDSLSINELRKKRKNGDLEIAVIQLPYASNMSDIEPFLYEEDVSIRFVRNASEFGKPDAVVIPGTKSTIRDIQFLKEIGLYEKILEFSRNGGFMAGICGGYQMLGKKLIDTEGSDTGIKGFEEKGLGLIEAVTYFRKEKQTIRVNGTFHHQQTGICEDEITGYEIHLGETIYTDESEKRPLFQLESNREEGYYSADGRTIGTYLHHLFHNDNFRHFWLNKVRQCAGLPLKPMVHISAMKDKRYDQLAEALGEHLNWEKIKKIISEWGHIRS